MGRIEIAFWGGLAVLAGLWLIADPLALRPAGFFPLRGSMVQLSGVLAMGCMSVAMILALRPRWPERWLGGLDKMYRLHKWLGIGGLVLGVVHWLWAQGPKWAVGYGWLERPSRGPQPVIDNGLQQVLSSQRGTAEGVGEWAFYAAVLLIAVALIHRIPYRLFYKTHRLLAVVYLVLVFHAVVLLQFSYWTTPLGVLMAAMLAGGTVAAVIVMLRRVGTGRKVDGLSPGCTTFRSFACSKARSTCQGAGPDTKRASSRSSRRRKPRGRIPSRLPRRGIPSSIGSPS
jgi:predicted ferric reductase